MLINKIIKLKDSKYKIFIDDEIITTYDNVILDNSLLYQKNIDKNLYNKIISDTNYYNIYNKIVKYILKRRRSKKEIIDYLNKDNLDNNMLNSIIDKLISVNLINDLEYAKAYINDKIYLSKDGINKIKIDLINQDISIDIIDKELNSIETSIMDSRLEKMILKKIETNHKYSNYFLKQKILNEMINLGYSKDRIIEILNNNLIENNNIIKQEYNRLYNKLSKKYSDYDLNLKIKEKLILKGFKSDSINKLLQEKTEV